MSFAYRTPPSKTGYARQDAAALNEWCGGLLAQLKYIVDALEQGTAVVNGDRISVAETPITTPYITISADGVIINDSEGHTIMRADHNGILMQTASGEEYIEVMPNQINIVCSYINCKGITSQAYNNAETTG